MTVATQHQSRHQWLDHQSVEPCLAAVVVAVTRVSPAGSVIGRVTGSRAPGACGALLADGAGRTCRAPWPGPERGDRLAAGLQVDDRSTSRGSPGRPRPGRCRRGTSGVARAAVEGLAGPAVVRAGRRSRHRSGWRPRPARSGCRRAPAPRRCGPCAAMSRVRVEGEHRQQAVDGRLGAAVAVDRPSASTPSTVRPVAGSYAGCPDALAPKNQAATTPASLRRPGASGRPRRSRAATGPASRRRRRSASRRPGSGSRPLSGPPDGEQPGSKRRRVAHRRRRASSGRRASPSARASAAGICEPQACQIGARQRPGQDARRTASCRASPPPARPRPRRAARAPSARPAGPPASTYAARPSTASAVASRAVDDQPGRRPQRRR